jgi:pimeloyl-ACP methyl ester carboxylesterase
MLILIHGLGGSPAEMQPFVTPLAAFGPALSPTLLSHGGRPLAAVGGYDALFDDLLAQIAGAEPAFVVGYSFGGYLALALAARAPDRVRAAAAIGTRFRYDGPAIDYLRHVITPGHLFGPEGERKAAMERRFGAEMAQASLARGLAIFERLSADPPLSDVTLQAIEAPVFLVSGEADQIAPGPESRRAAALLQRGRLGLFPGRGHPIDQVPVDRVAIAVARFFRDVEQGTFEPGGMVDLGESLVSGGTPASGAGGASVTFRPARKS